MKVKSDNYNVAVQLREQGLSYSQIGRIVGVSKSTLSVWLHHLPLILERRKVLPSEVFRTQGQRLHTERLEKIAAAVSQACQEIKPLSLNELKIAGAMLYWAEGTKDPKTEPVTISNSDPELVRFALRWLRDVCCVPDHKIHVQMHLHTDLDVEECLTFWMRVTQLPREQFMKTQIKQSSLGHRKKRSYQGTVQIRVWDRQLYRRIQGWIRGLWQLAPVAQPERAAGF